MRRAHRIATIAVLGTICALAGVTAATAGGGGHCAPDEAQGNRVELEGACFTPSTLHADAGETITFVNRDPVAHNVSGTGWGNYEDMGRGDRFKTSFADEGIYPFACTLHPGMTGVVVVGDTDAETVAEVQPLAASTSPPSDGDAWIAAGALGLAIGAAVGAGLAVVRRRRTTTV
ncbi:MAG TPA: plastocyanin/azurin family copper-binding protein [Actinomycetota bacterium]|nr:plastocyanin/azurin family copper-binding protein [Actinomycetota bacterium]